MAAEAERTRKLDSSRNPDSAGSVLGSVVTEAKISEGLLRSLAHQRSISPRATASSVLLAPTQSVRPILLTIVGLEPRWWRELIGETVKISYVEFQTRRYRPDKTLEVVPTA